MTNLPSLVHATQPRSPRASRQLSIAFETASLRGMPKVERVKIIAHLANILLQAAGVAIGEHDDDER